VRTADTQPLRLELNKYADFLFSNPERILRDTTIFIKVEGRLGRAHLVCVPWRNHYMLWLVGSRCGVPGGGWLALHAVNGLSIPRVFTKAGQDPYGLFSYDRRDSVIRNPDGSVVFHIRDIEVPAQWSQLATDILVQKYIRKAGVPQKDEHGKVRIGPDGKPLLGSESSIKQVVHRLAGCWRHWGETHGYFATGEDAQAFYDELSFMLLNQMGAPNSPQWFNTGLAWAYGITGSAQGHYYADPATGEVKRSEDAYTRPQPHACADYFTRLYTSEGIKFIGEVVEQGLTGIRVFDGESFVQIQAVKHNGCKNVSRIKLKNGNYLDLTEDHLVFSAERRRKDGGSYVWTPAGDLKEGMRLQQPHVLDLRERNVFPEDLAKARLAGWVTGDGSVGIYQNVMRLEIISVNDEEHEHILQDLEEVFGDQLTFWVTTFETQNPDLKGRRIHLSGKKIHQFVEEYDLMRRCKDVQVPRHILGGAPQERREFLKALFQADGCVRVRIKVNGNGGDVCLTTISEELAFDVLQLLNSLGIYARISLCRDSREDRNVQYQVIVAYGGAREQFLEQVGFLAQEKQQKLEFLNQLVTGGKSLPLIREEEIVSIQSIGVRDVYDIQTESGRFLANGVVVHNCFIQSVRDDLVNPGGIFDLAVREARIFKYGSGTGSNFSSLRGRGEPLSGGGTSSGLMSFLKLFDAGAGAIKSGGTTRRAAKMVCLDMDHPEIETFIMWKYREEQKVADLVAGSHVTKRSLQRIADAAKAKGTDWKKNPELALAIKEAKHMGVPLNYVFRVLQLAEQGIFESDFREFNTHYESEAYQTVSGQNANNSVRIPNAFLTAVEAEGDWNLIKRTDGGVWKSMKARKLWDEVCLAAWHSADPGVQFDTTINEWHTCPEDGKIRASNPCSEFLFLDDTACNLASINVVKFLKEDGAIDIAAFRHATRLFTIVLEISVLMAQFPSEPIARLSFQFRSLGLGYANVGSTLMRLGIPYDSDAARAYIAAISAIMTGQSYATSAEMASVLGPFPGYEKNKEHMLKVIRNHRLAAYDSTPSAYEGLSIAPQGLKAKHCPKELLQAARACWDEAVELGLAHGYRNSQSTLLAPTGTIGLLMDCDTTGIEPDFAIVKFKKLAGGGYFKIINQSVPSALRKLGYTEKAIDGIVKYASGHGTLKGSRTISHEQLRKKGFTDAMLQKVEQHFPSAFDITFVFNRFTLGDETMQKLGFAKEQYEDTGFSVLGALGFSKEEVDAANEHVCGTMTVEGAPGLEEEHLPVFDCANKCGKKGKRFLRYESHIFAMAAAQPFLSGAISKTINMPNHATIKDIGDAYMLAWKMMVKATALYRDGSKLSQPLNTVTDDLSAFEQDDVDEATVTPENVQRGLLLRHAGAPKWEGLAREARIANRPIAVMTAEYDDGALGSVKVAMEEEDEEYRGLLSAYSDLASFALACGIPLNELVDQFTFADFAPGGPVHGDPAIKNATSPVDYLFRVLGHEYLGRKDLVHVKEASSMRTKQTAQRKQVSEEVSAIAEARAKGYTGEKCPGCGSLRLKRNGTCNLCEDCGTTTGCS
jgi:ribonucleoside-diphosphate reductase alpha chain